MKAFGDLQVSPFDTFGNPVEIVDGIFGGREKYMVVVRSMEQALYSE